MSSKGSKKSAYFGSLIPQKERIGIKLLSEYLEKKGYFDFKSLDRKYIEDYVKKNRMPDNGK